MNIDREIAEKVRGWDLITKDDRKCWDSEGIFQGYEEWWSPSTNIQHAMEVEAEMFRRGFISHTSHYEDEDGEIYFHNYSYEDEVKGFAYKKLLPEAICLAALEAVK